MEEKEKLIEALSVLALNDLCSYIDLDGNPVMCDWDAYEGLCEYELTRYRLTRKQFDIIVKYIEENYKGRL